MTQLILPRRKFLAGMAALIAAPTVIRVAQLMPIKVERPEEIIVRPKGQLMHMDYPNPPMLFVNENQAKFIEEMNLAPGAVTWVKWDEDEGSWMQIPDVARAA